MSSNGHKPIDRAGFLKPIFKTEDVEVPELGTVRIRELSAAQRSEYRADTVRLQQADAGSTEYGAWTLKLLARHIVDAEGEPIFTLDPADLRVLADLPDRTVELLADKALQLSGLKGTAEGPPGE